MVYDSSAGKVILFGGYDGAEVLDDTWTYDPVGNAWTELRPGGAPPTARSNHSMVYDSRMGKVILFGGLSSTGTLLNDTWVYDPAGNSWAELHPAGSLPPACTMHSMVYDSITGKAILFGAGDVSAGVLRNDTWAYEP
jgi:N-acetylneuraminic acid mutarotase